MKPVQLSTERRIRSHLAPQLNVGRGLWASVAAIAVYRIAQLPMGILDWALVATVSSLFAATSALVSTRPIAATISDTTVYLLKQTVLTILNLLRLLSRKKCETCRRELTSQFLDVLMQPDHSAERETSCGRMIQSQ